MFRIWKYRANTCFVVWVDKRVYNLVMTSLSLCKCELLSVSKKCLTRLYWRCDNYQFYVTYVLHFTFAMEFCLAMWILVVFRYNWYLLLLNSIINHFTYWKYKFNFKLLNNSVDFREVDFKGISSVRNLMDFVHLLRFIFIKWIVFGAQLAKCLN